MSIDRRPWVTRRLAIVLLCLLALMVASLPAAGAEPAAGAQAAPGAPRLATDGLESETGAAEPAGVAPAAKTRKLALGVSQWPYDDLSDLDAFTASVGRAPATWSVWSDWGGGNAAFPTALMAGLAARGVVPVVLWQPVDPSDLKDPRFSYRHIIQGRHDAYLRAWAEAAKAHGGTVLLRLAHEHDGTWFPWGTDRFDNSPKRFQKMWRHVWNIFRGPDGVGATNVKFVWSPNQPCVKCVPYAKTYPGDAFVDYAGFSSFNWSGKQPWKSMVQTFDLAYRKLRAVTRKPIIVAETGSSPEGGSKPRWIREGYPAVYARFPRIKLIVYFNVDSLTMANQRDWRLTTPARALTAYRAIVAQPRFQGVIR